jgi:hypothetical protein
LRIKGVSASWVGFWKHGESECLMSLLQTLKLAAASISIYPNRS